MRGMPSIAPMADVPLLDPKAQGWLILLAALALLIGRLYGAGVLATPAF